MENVQNFYADLQSYSFLLGDTNGTLLVVSLMYI